jgi:hypothetical protein
MRLYANTIDTVVKQIQIIGIILAFTFTFFGIMLRPVNDNAPGIFLIIFIISCLLMLILSLYYLSSVRLSTFIKEAIDYKINSFKE